MTLIPYHDKIIIEPEIREGVIKDAGKKYHTRGKVVAVGKNVEFVKAGDLVFFVQYGIRETELTDGTIVYLVPESSEWLLGKIEDVGGEESV